jgi:hypothetical protein
MIRTCIFSAGLTRQSQNLVAGPEKFMCRDGEWSEDKSLGACPKRNRDALIGCVTAGTFCTLRVHALKSVLPDPERLLASIPWILD